MTDLVARLRLGGPNALEVTDEAADEIERLRGHKEEADRHIKTIAELRHRIDTMVVERDAERKIYNDAIASHLAEIKEWRTGERP